MSYAGLNLVRLFLLSLHPYLKNRDNNKIQKVQIRNRFLLVPSFIQMLYLIVIVEFESEPKDIVAKILWPLLHPVQWRNHPCGCDEQRAATRLEDALQV